MIQLARIGCHLEKNLLFAQKNGYLNHLRLVHLKQCTVATLPENHDERNMKLKRPLSPHLTVYAPQMTTMLSITHRFTGMALAGYAVMLGIGSVVLPDTIPHYIDALAAQHVGGFVINSGKFILSYPLAYHFWNGIRHLLWDTGRFLTNTEVNTTGYIMLALSFGTSIGICLL